MELTASPPQWVYEFMAKLNLWLHFISLASIHQYYNRPFNGQPFIIG